jgi:hypothetical protein
MAATDFAKLVYVQLWTLLEAHTGFTDRVKAGNRVKVTDGKLDPEKQLKQDADFPEAMLVHGGFTDGMLTGKTGYQTFAAGATTSAQSWIEMHTDVFRAVITHQDLRMDINSALVAEFLTALRKGGARLGLTYVWSWGPVVGTNEIVSDGEGPTKGTLRQVTRIEIPVTRRHHGEDLLT